MTPEQLVLLFVAASLGGFAFGVTGFAFGVIASLFLHHAFLPRDVVFIVVGGGFLLNLLALPRFWADIDWRGALPYLAGATFGMPLGFVLLSHLPAGSARLVSSLIIISYCVFALFRQGTVPFRLPVLWGRVADTGIGFAGGVIGGVSGLGPLLPNVWYGLCGKDKRQARGLAQPYGLYVQGGMFWWLLWSGGNQTEGLPTISLAVVPMLVGAWLGLKLFDGLSLVAFRSVIIWLSLFGAAVLLVRQLMVLA